MNTNISILKYEQSQNAAAQNLHAAAPSTQRSLSRRQIIIGISILNNNHSRLRLHHQRLIVIGSRSLIGLNCYHLLHVGLVVVATVVVVIVHQIYVYIDGIRVILMVILYWIRISEV